MLRNRWEIISGRKRKVFAECSERKSCERKKLLSCNLNYSNVPLLSSEENSFLLKDDDEEAKKKKMMMKKDEENVGSVRW